MYVVAVNIFVKPENVDAFIIASIANAKGTRTEPGNLRWDFIQHEDDKTRFMLYEVYKTKDDFVKHQQTPHYLAWRDGVKDWMAQPRQGLKFNSIFPSDADWNK